MLRVETSAAHPAHGAKIKDRLGGIEPSTHLSIALPVSYKAVKKFSPGSTARSPITQVLGIEPSWAVLQPRATMPKLAAREIGAGSRIRTGSVSLEG